MNLSYHIEKMREHTEAAATACAAGKTAVAHAHIGIVREACGYVIAAEECRDLHPLATVRLADAQAAAARVSALNQRQPIDLSRSVHPAKKL